MVIMAGKALEGDAYEIEYPTHIIRIFKKICKRI